MTYATCTGGVVTLTANNSYAAGQYVTVSGVNPTGYNDGGAAVAVSAVTPTSFAHAVISCREVLRRGMRETIANLGGPAA